MRTSVLVNLVSTLKYIQGVYIYISNDYEMDINIHCNNLLLSTEGLVQD